MTYHDSLLNRVERLARQAGRTDEVMARLHQQEYDLRHARDAAVNELQQLRPLRNQLEAANAAVTLQRVKIERLQAQLAENEQGRQLQAAEIERLDACIEKIKDHWAETGMNVRAAIEELEFGPPQPAPVAEPARCPECEPLQAEIEGLRAFVGKVRLIVDGGYITMTGQIDRIIEAVAELDGQPTATTKSSQETNSSELLTSPWLRVDKLASTGFAFIRPPLVTEPVDDSTTTDGAGQS